MVFLSSYSGKFRIFYWYLCFYLILRSPTDSLFVLVLLIFYVFVRTNRKSFREFLYTTTQLTCNIMYWTYYDEYIYNNNWISFMGSEKNGKSLSANRYWTSEDALLLSRARTVRFKKFHNLIAISWNTSRC